MAVQFAVMQWNMAKTVIERSEWWELRGTDQPVGEECLRLHPCSRPQWTGRATLMLQDGGHPQYGWLGTRDIPTPSRRPKGRRFGNNQPASGEPKCHLNHHPAEYCAFLDQ